MTSHSCLLTNSPWVHLLSCVILMASITTFTTPVGAQGTAASSSKQAKPSSAIVDDFKSKQNYVTTSAFNLNDDSSDMTPDGIRDQRQIPVQAKVEKPSLIVWLQNEDHAVIVSWKVLRRMPEISGFIVNYKMEGRENYDSSRLERQVRNFTLHSLHDDKAYSICVSALNSSQSLVEEKCVSWSKASSNMIMGIIAGTTLMVPCVFFLLLILYKDSRVRRKIKARGLPEVESDSKKCLIDIMTINGFHKQSNLREAHHDHPPFHDSKMETGHADFENGFAQSGCVDDDKSEETV